MHVSVAMGVCGGGEVFMHVSVAMGVCGGGGDIDCSGLLSCIHKQGRPDFGMLVAFRGSPVSRLHQHRPPTGAP